MEPTPLQLQKDDIFVNEIYRGYDDQFLYLDKECDPIIDRIKKEKLPGIRFELCMHS